MQTVNAFRHLGRANFGWLKAHHHFSFGRYYDPAHMGLKALRVWNDDHIEAGGTFEPHPHDNMEIITFVRQGAVHHGDNQGNQGVTPAGSVQVMSAGTGIVHSEAASPTDDTKLFQIWIIPHTRGVAPRWEQAELNHPAITSGSLPLLVSGLAEDEGKALFIHAYARIFGGKVAPGGTLSQPLGGTAYAVVSSGELTLADGTVLEAGDGLELTDTTLLAAKAGGEGAELVVVDVSQT